MKIVKMGVIKRLIFIIIFSFVYVLSFAQKESDVISFSGTVMDGAGKELIAVPFANILVKSKGRGTYSDFNGFFSIVVEKGDTIKFSAIGYKDVDYIIPITLPNNKYALVQLMTRDTINLPETVIFPWPSREHYKVEFLAMDVTKDLETRARENLTVEKLMELKKVLPHDGGESTSYYLHQQATTYYHIGQAPPQKIFSPLAWQQFFKAWKNGDFKRDKNKK